MPAVRVLVGFFLLGASLPHVATCASDYKGTCTDPERLELGAYTIFSVSNTTSEQEDLYYLDDSTIDVSDEFVEFHYHRDGWDYVFTYERGGWR